MRLDTAKYAYHVVFMCRLLGVSTSGYYEWRGRPESATEARRKELMLLIRKAFDASNGTYGHRRIHAQLGRWGQRCSPELVRALMRKMGLVPCQPRPWRVSLTQHAAASVPDLVRRDFTAEQPGTKMVGDIPYIPTGEGWLFLATVIDSCTKEVIGYAMDDHYDHQARACAAFRGRSTAPNLRGLLARPMVVSFAGGYPYSGPGYPEGACSPGCAAGRSPPEAPGLRGLVPPVPAWWRHAAAPPHPVGGSASAALERCELA
jgi:putative transposase